MNQKSLPRLSRAFYVMVSCAMVTGMCYLAPRQQAPAVQQASASTPSATITTVSEATLPQTPAVTNPTASVQNNATDVQAPAPKLLPSVSPSKVEEVNQVGGKGWFEKAVAEIERSEYFVRYHDEKGVFTSPNRAQDLRFFYQNDGFAMQPRVNGEAWNLALNLSLSSDLKPSAKPAFEKNENELLVRHANFTMQYVNTEAGMRQNFLVHQDPNTENANLNVRLGITGNVTASLINGHGVEFINGDKNIVAQYKDLKVWDANGQTLPAEIKLEGNEIVLAVNDAQATYPITIDPLSCNPNWTATGFNREQDRMGYSVAIAGTAVGRLANRTFNLDANNRVYADVIVGSPYYDGLGFNRGAVFVYYGGFGGLNAAASWVREGYQDQELFGYSVASAGDFYTGNVLGGAASLNYAELVVGAPQHSSDDFVGRSQEGRVYYFAGSATGLPTVTGDNMSKANDVLGLNYFYSSPINDNAAGHSAAEIAARRGAQYGFDVAGAGDVDNSGVGDVIIGAPRWSNNAANGGSINVLFGGNTWANGGGITPNNLVTSLIYRATPNAGLAATGLQFGFSVACAGDFNNDNFDDLLVGAPFYETNVAQTDEGAAYYIPGLAAGDIAVNVNRAIGNAALNNGIRVVQGNQMGAQLGFDVAGQIFDGANRHAGTYGNARLAVSAPYYDGVMPSNELNEGAIFVSNTPTNTFQNTHAAAHNAALPFTQTMVSGEFVCESNQVGALYGYSISSAGDLNEDNFGDLIVGAPFMEGPASPLDTDEGTAVVYYGSASGLQGYTCTINRCILEGNRIRGEYGTSVAGSIQGAQGGVTEFSTGNDTYSDIVIGVPGWDVNPGLAFANNTNEGRAVVYNGMMTPTFTWITANNFNFCPNTKPLVQVQVSGFTAGTQFRAYLQQDLEVPLRDTLITFTPDVNGNMVFNLPTTVRAGNTTFCFPYFDVGTCCRFTPNFTATGFCRNGVVTPLGATFSTPANNSLQCGGLTLPITVNLQGFNAGDTYAINYTLVGSGVTYTQAGVFAGNPITLTQHPVPVNNTTAIITTTYQLLSVTRGNINGSCNQTLTSVTRNFQIRPTPWVSITPQDFCPGQNPSVVVEFRRRDIANCPDITIQYKINGGATQTFGPLNVALIDATLISADTVRFALDNAGAALAPGFNITPLAPVTFELVSFQTVCFTAPLTCAYTPTNLGIASMYTINPTNQQPDVQFRDNPIWFCDGTAPQVWVDVDNVGVNTTWEIGWEEQNGQTMALSGLQIQRGTGPEFHRLTNATYPSVQYGTAKYYLRYIIAGGCTTNYAGPSYIADAIAIDANAAPQFTFNNIPQFCRGTAPAITFDVTGIPANYPFRVRGRIYIPGTQQTVPFVSKIYPGAGAGLTVDNLTINGILEPTLRTQTALWQYFFDSFENVPNPNMGNLTCSETLTNVSTNANPVTSATINFRNPAPSYCIGGMPMIEVNLPTTGTWVINYVETPLGGIAVNRSQTINAAFTGWYQLTTGNINATQVTYSLSSITPPNGQCGVTLGNAITVFATPSNALPMVAFNNTPTAFCQGGSPSVSLNVSNVPPSGMGTWRIYYREGASAQMMTAPMSGPMVNFMLPTNVSFTNQTIFIDRIEVIGGCTNNLNLSRTYTANILPEVQFQMPLPTTACGGVVPTMYAVVANIPQGQSYRIDWSIDGVAQTPINRLQTKANGRDTVALAPTPNIGANTAYRITQITNTSTGCTFIPAPAVSTINLQVAGGSLPNALWTQVPFSYCPNTMPVLGVNISGVGANEMWTMEYEALNADNSVRYVDTKVGIGPNANYTFTPAQMPTLASTTYRIRRVTNNATGCTQVLSQSVQAINVGAGAPVTLAQPGDVCAGNLPTLTLSVPGIGLAQQYIIQWRENGVLKADIGVGPTFNLTATGNYATPGTRTVQLVNLFFFGVGSPACAPTVDMTPRTFNVTNTGVTASFAGSNQAAVCMGSVPTVNVMVPNSPNVTLRYRINNGVIQTIQANNVSMINIAPMMPIMTNTTYSLVDITAGSCFGALNSSVEVKVRNLPMAAWNGANLAPVCSDPRLSVNVSMIDDANHNWTVFYRRVGEGITRSVSGTGNINGFSFAPNPLPGLGTFQYELISVQNNTTNCTSVAGGIQTITVTPGTLGAVTLNLSGTSFCAGSVPTATVTLPGVAPAQAWSLTYAENGGANQTANGVGPNGTLTLNGNYSAPGVYSVALTGVNVAGAPCQPSAMDVKTFTVVDAPNATLPVASQTVCQGSNAMLPINVTIPGGIGNAVLVYSINGVNQAPVAVVNGSNTLMSPAINGTTFVRLVSISNGSCTRTFNPQPLHTINVTAGLAPVVSAQTSPQGCMTNGSVTVTGNGIQTGLTYQLFDANTMMALGNPMMSAGTSQMFSNLGVGSYFVRVSDANGCAVNTGTIVIASSGQTIPTITSVVDGGSSVTVNWTAIMGGAPYVLEYREATQGTWNSITTNNTSAVVSGIQSGRNYEFRVRSACSGFSTIATFGSASLCATNPVLATPTGFQFRVVSETNVTKNIEISWVDVPGAVGYAIQWRSATSGATVWQNILLCTNEIPLVGGRRVYQFPFSFSRSIPYEARVRTQCDVCRVSPNTLGSSFWTFAVQFRGDDVTVVDPASQFSVYPNPTNGSFNVEFNSFQTEKVIVRLLDNLGRQVFETNHETTQGYNSIPVDLNNSVAKGIYQLQLIQGDETKTVKVVVN